MSLHHAALFVSDLDTSAAFYSGLLGLRETGRGRVAALGYEQVFLSAGEQHADLVLSRREDGATPPADKRELFHLAFALEDDRSIEDLVSHLTADETPFMGPIEHESRFDGSGLRLSVYLRDPDGHVVEVTQDRG